MLKTLLKQVKQYKTASLLTPVFIMLEVVLDVLIPFVTAKLIDYGISALRFVWFCLQPARCHV